MKTVAALLLLVLVAVPAWAQSRPQGKPAKTPPAASHVDPRTVLRSLEAAFSAVADRATPAVVNVSTVSKKPTAGSPEDPERFRDFFGDEFYERYFKRPAPREEARASGSGVIVDAKGYILTNNHVIENAQAITVRLSDSRKFPATLVGRDPKTDLAVLKVEASGHLPVADLGDSDRLRVGQWAIAIGNPFGLDRTVTVGIISATARNHVGVATYENFIQTDASINPGNSGGPLLNLDGKVIGINTAIVAAGQGIGFSIPINEAKSVMAQLITGGRVVRGWLGVAIQDVTDELAASFGVPEREGVLIADVIKGGPAEVAGVRAGDVVVEFGATKIREVSDLQRRVAGVAPGESAAVTVIRDGKPVRVAVTIGEMPADDPAPASAGNETEGYGIQVETLSPDAAERMNLPLSRGVLVVDVAAGGPADRAGLHRGDVILEVGREAVVDGPGVARALARVPAGDETILLYIRRHDRGARNEYVALERPKRP
jgi:serine protease DegQ